MLRNTSHVASETKPPARMPIMSEPSSEKMPARRLTSLFASVKGWETREQFWKEDADVVSFSSSGAGFHVGKPCVPGQLLSIMMALPIHLRAYDHDKKLYKIWGLVQHCQQVSTGDEPSYFVGVAFIGRTAPSSYQNNSLTSYRICGMSSDGLWIAKDADKPFINRKESRYRYSINVSLFVLDTEQRVVCDEKTETENISENGALVISNLDIAVGDRIRFHSVDFGFTALAVVRNRQTRNDGQPRISLEFVDDLFPVLELVPKGSN
jgi:PilZ domain.